MGCSTSKLDNEEAVQICKDRKEFIKQAVEHRMRFASGHIAYIQSMKRVSAALRDYINSYEPHEVLLDSFTNPPFTPVKKASPGFISISSKSFSVKPIQSAPNSTIKINYLRSGGNPSVFVEERPPSHETVRIETYSPMNQYGMDGFFGMQSSPTNFFRYSPDNRSNFPPPSPQTSQWDFFWNPFTSLDYYDHLARSSMDHTVLGDDSNGLRQVQEEEGIPELEEGTEQEETDNIVNKTDGRTKVEMNSAKEEVVTVEDIDDDDDVEYAKCGADTEHEAKGIKSHDIHSIEVSKAQNAAQVSNQEMAVGDQEANKETPGFTVYVNRRPTSMEEVISDLEAQFNELSAMKMLNPVTLLRSASSRSSSSRFLINSSSLRDECYESTNESSEEACMFSDSHQSTLDRLYAWENKLYQEVRAGERVRLAYEKKCSQLRHLDGVGEDPSSVDKTRAAISDLHTQIKVSIHSVEAVSKRIETLRDEELQPQLFELIQGLARMWKVMAECHQAQKHTLDEAKLLLAGMPTKLSRKKTYTIMPPSSDPHRPAGSAANLETQLRNWRACFESWITSQRSYVHALTGWLLRCVCSDPDTSKLPFFTRHSIGAPPIFSLCIQLSRLLDAFSMVPVLDGLDFFATGVGSLYAKQLQEDSRHTSIDSKRFGGELQADSGGNTEVMEIGQLEEEIMTVEKMAEAAIRVLCAGMSVAVGSLTDFAIGSAEGYSELVKQWENRNKICE